MRKSTGEWQNERPTGATSSITTVTWRKLKLKQKTLIMQFRQVQIVFSALGLNYSPIFISILSEYGNFFFNVCPKMI